MAAKSPRIVFLGTGAQGALREPFDIGILVVKAYDAKWVTQMIEPGQ